MRFLLLAALLLPACVGRGTPGVHPPAGPPAPPGDDYPSEAAPSLAGTAGAASAAAADAVAYVRSRGLLLPVAAVPRHELRDSFGDPRDAGARRHGAIDIMAPRGTPVLSADDGRIHRLSNSRLGGISLYAVDPTGQIVYYYAHLDAYAPGITAGMTIAKGDTLGFVGSTGNATTPHLHFQIMRMPADGRYWSGEAINPYPILAGSTP